MTYASEVLADAPVVYWKLDETSGDFLDSSGNALHAPNIANVTRGEPGAVDGGSSILRTGTINAGAYRANEAALQVTAVTLECLFRTTSTGVTQTICGKWASTGTQRSVNLRISSLNQVQAEVRTDAATLALTDGTAANVTDGNWHHAAVTWDPTTDVMRLYVDGVQRISGALAGTTMLVGTANLQVGSHPDGARAVDQVDEFAYYGTALSAARIAAHVTAFDSALPVPELPYRTEVLADTPILAWELSEATGQFQDYSGNDRHSTSNANLARQQAGLLGATEAVAPTTGATNSGATRPNEASYQVASGSVEAVFKHTTGLAVEQWVGGRWGASAANRVLALKVTNADVLQVGLRTDTVTDTFYSYTGGATWADGNYHHFVATYDPSTDTLTLYIDGSSAQTWTVAGSTLYQGTGAVGIGGTFVVGRIVAGVDEFAYYGTALSSTRVQDHYVALTTVNVDAGVAIEADTAIEAAVSAENAAGVAIETDAAIAGTVLESFAPDVVSELDSAPAITELQVQSLEVVETDTAIAPADVISGFFAGVAIETDVATDSALALSPATVVETDVALPADVNQVQAINAGVASEVDIAYGVGIRVTIHAGVAVETDSIPSVIVGRVLGTAVETDTVVNPFLIRAGYAEAVLDDAPIAYFRLDEPAGTTVAVDVSGYGNNGVYGSTLIGQIPSPTSSLMPRDGNPARNFSLEQGDGFPELANLIVTPDGSAEWWNDDQPRTVEYWIRVPRNYRDVSHSAEPLLVYLNSSGPGVGYTSMGTALTSDGRLRLVHDDMGAASFGSDTTVIIADDRPHHVVVTYSDPAPAGGGAFDGRLVTLYLDGKRVGAFEVGDISTADSAPLYVMAISPEEIGTSGNYLSYDTQYDEIALYDYDLTANQVFEHFQQSGLVQARETDTAKAATIETRYETAVRDDAPSLYWRMSGALATPDDSGNGRPADYYPTAGTAVPGLVRQIGEDLALRGGQRDILDAWDSDVGTLWGFTSSFEFWFQVDAGSIGTGDLFYQYFNTTAIGHLAVELTSGGVLRVRYYDHEFTATQYLTGPALNDGRPHHIVVTHYNNVSSSDIRLYVDGKRHGAPMVVNFQDSWTMEQFGVRGVLSGGELATIDEVAAYDHELTAARIFQHFMAGDGLRAFETDVALPVSYDVSIVVGVAVETDTGHEARPTLLVYAGVATETSSAAGYLAPTLFLTGSGVLIIESEGFLTIPEFQLEVLDDQINRAPASLQVSMAGGLPETDVRFYIDGVLVWTVEADTDGNLSIVSLNVTPLVGGTVGIHTVEARQTLPDSTVISCSDTYEMLRPPVLYPSTMGADADPVEVPGALVGSVRHWVWQDLMPEADGGIGSWIMPINPRETSSPHFEHMFSSRHTTSKTGQFHVSQPARNIVEWTFSGYLPNKAYADKLREYRDLNRRFYIIDHHNRAWKVVVSELEIVPRLRHTFNGVADDWGSDYTVKVAILEQDYLIPETP